MSIPKFPDESFYKNIKQFNREFFSAKEDFTVIGKGSLGGKAQGLAFFNEILKEQMEKGKYPDFEINIPKMTVITTDFFDQFMKLNDLYDYVWNITNETDERIAHKFVKGRLPSNLNGDLMALIKNIHEPLAIRSSSLLEDAMYEPFAGIYSTKMIPNNQPDADTRFKKLKEAIKLIYASTYFKEARNYIKSTPHSIKKERMAIIIQEVMGKRHEDLFYPDIGGVIRTYNYYPTGGSTSEDGVVDLVLGLGKTIVDGGVSWFYSPDSPSVSPPYNSIGDLMSQTQLRFWAINMKKQKDI